MVYSFWYHFFIFLKIIGLAPMTCVQNTAVSKPFETSKSGRAYGIVFLTLWILTHSYVIVLNSSTFIEAHDFSVIWYVFSITSNVLLVFIAIFTLFIKERFAVDICNELHEINYWLEIFDKYYLRKKVDRKLKLLIFLNLLFCVITIIDRALSTCFGPLGWIQIIDLILSSWIVIQFIGMKVLMGAIAETINEQFQWFYDNPRIVVEQLIFENGQDAHDISLIVTAKINILQDIYLKLTKITTRLTKFYSLIMLVCIIGIFRAKIFDVFFIMNKLLREDTPFSICQSVNIYLAFLWRTLLLLTITFSVTKLTSEVS